MKTNEPTTQEMLDFLVKLATWPYEMYMCHDNASARGKGREWLLSYNRRDKKGFDGCVYAPSQEALLLKGMNLLRTQEKVAAMLKEALK